MLDFTYLPRVPIDKADVYRNLEKALHSLQQYLEPLTFAKAMADDELVKPLIAFWSAWKGVPQAIGENEPLKLWETLCELQSSSAPAAYLASVFLNSGRMDRFPELSGEILIKRILNYVREAMDQVPQYGESYRRWHHVKNRVAEYADALLEALRPADLDKQPALPEKRTPRWDGMRLCYGDSELRNYQTKVAPAQAAILEALERAQWPDRPVKIPESRWSSLHVTLARINARIKDRLIQLKAAGDGKSVIWSKSEYV